MEKSWNFVGQPQWEPWPCHCIPTGSVFPSNGTADHGHFWCVCFQVLEGAVPARVRGARVPGRLDGPRRGEQGPQVCGGDRARLPEPRARQTRWVAFSSRTRGRGGVPRAVSSPPGLRWGGASQQIWVRGGAEATSRLGVEGGAGATSRHGIEGGAGATSRLGV